MPSPFPGMDPYIERPEIWPDFHNQLIAAIKAAFQPLLRPRYVAISEDRLFIVESDRPIRPDVAVLRTSSPNRPPGLQRRCWRPDAPAVFELWREEIRQPLLRIVEPAAGNRVVTAVEVLSPDNKAAGPGRISYLQKREEYWAAGTNLVEIDLLRAGQPTVRFSAEQIAALAPWTYLVAVTRRWPSRHEVYAVPLPHRLPRVGIPLADDDRDVVLDLQAAFTRCWDENPYPGDAALRRPAAGKADPRRSALVRGRAAPGGVASPGTSLSGASHGALYADLQGDVQVSRQRRPRGSSGLPRCDQFRCRPGRGAADGRKRLVDMAETNLLLGEPLPRPDPTCTDEDADLEEPIYLLLTATHQITISPARPS